MGGIYVYLACLCSRLRFPSSHRRIRKFTTPRIHSQAGCDGFSVPVVVHQHGLAGQLTLVRVGNFIFAGGRCIADDLARQDLSVRAGRFPHCSSLLHHRVQGGVDNVSCVVVDFGNRHHTDCGRSDTADRQSDACQPEKQAGRSCHSLWHGDLRDALRGHVHHRRPGLENQRGIFRRHRSIFILRFRRNSGMEQVCFPHPEWESMEYCSVSPRSDRLDRRGDQSVSLVTSPIQCSIPPYVFNGLNPSPSASCTTPMTMKARGSTSWTMAFRAATSARVMTQYKTGRPAPVYPPVPSRMVTPRSSSSITRAEIASASPVTIIAVRTVPPPSSVDSATKPLTYS